MRYKINSRMSKKCYRDFIRIYLNSVHKCVGFLEALASAVCETPYRKLKERTFHLYVHVVIKMKMYLLSTTFISPR